jgi:uncharacterized protein DUF6335
MAKKSGKSRGQKRTPSTKRAGAGTRAAKRSGAGPKRTAKSARNTGRRTAGAATPRGKAAKKKSATPQGRATQKRAAKATAAKTASRKGSKAKGKTTTKARRPAPARLREGGTGRERQLAQTPETGRSVKGPVNPFPTKRSTGTASGAGGTRQAPGLERARRHLREVDETVPSPPSSLELERRPSAARTGRQEMREARRDHPEVSPDITAGDVDADWASAYDAGDEAPGGDNPTPDQDRVDDIGKALGVEYEDNEELKASDKIAARDKKRWELDPASSDDYRDRD